MPDDHSFDVVSKPDFQEINNAVNMSMKEILTRFDFKGSISKIEIEGETIKIVSDDAFRLKSVVDILQNKFVKRSVPLKFFDYGKIEEALGGTAKQVITIKKGIPQDKAKEVTKLVQALGLKVRTQIQGDEVRVFAKKIDDLQTVMQKLKAANLTIAVQFANYR